LQASRSKAYDQFIKAARATVELAHRPAGQVAAFVRARKQF